MKSEYHYKVFNHQEETKKQRQSVCLFWHSNYISIPYFPIWNDIPSKPNGLQFCADQQKKKRYLEMKQD